jgi:LPXTG-motif cell wall-anchored protein
VAVAVALMLGGVATMLAPAGAEEAPGAAEASKITITQTPAGTSGPCVPPPLGLTYTSSNTDDAFTLRVVASSAPCTPIEAKAVIYAMPSKGSMWPQTLSEVVPFTISVAGVTEIVFSKDCSPVQFDVLTGQTPQVISPLGAWHGPLLFPFDTSTSLQYFGNKTGCTPTTSTTSTTAPPSGPTSSTVPEVGGSTTVPGSSTTQPEVAGVTTVPPTVGGVSTPQQPAALALTGSSSAWVALLGAGMVGAGALMLLAARRRDAAGLGA